MSNINDRGSYCTFEEAVKILPATHVTGALNKLTSPNLVRPPVYFTKSQFITVIASSALASIGGVFLLLAAQGVLPHGVNAISQLGGTVSGSVLITAGIVIIIMVATRLRKRAEKEHSIQNKIANAEYNALEGEMDSGIFSSVLKDNEMFVVIGKTQFTVYVLPIKGERNAYATFDLKKNENPPDQVQNILTTHPCIKLVFCYLRKS